MREDNRLVLNNKISYSVLSFILVDKIGLCQNYRHFLGTFPISVCNDPKDDPMGLYIYISHHLRPYPYIRIMQLAQNMAGACRRVETKHAE